VVKPNATPDPGPPTPLGEGFLFAARLSAEKGLPLLLDAWSRNPVGTLRVVGDGPLRSLVESRPDVVFLGPQDHEGVLAAMRASAVVLAPSTWHDVLPTVILEALAANVSVVLSTLRIDREIREILGGSAANAPEERTFLDVLGRRVSEIASDLDKSEVQLHSSELKTLARRMEGATADLANLRALLTLLRERAAEVRAAAA